MVADTVLTPQQIDDAQEAAFLGLMEEGYNGGMGGRQWDRASARAIEQAVLQSPEVQRLREDAGRLDWIISQDDCVVNEGTNGFWLCWIDEHDHSLSEYQTGSYMTARDAIDAAMKEQP